MKNIRSLMSSNSAEWRTPRGLFLALHAEHGFTLDAAATHGNTQLPRYFTAKEDGLAQDWSGHRVWLNPPYGKMVPLWMAKAATAQTLVVVLVPARTDTAWWHEWVLPRATQVAYVRGRLTFEGANSGAPFPSAIITYEPRARKRRAVAIDRNGRQIPTARPVSRR